MTPCTPRENRNLPSAVRAEPRRGDEQVGPVETKPTGGLRRVKQTWDELRQSEPGSRFHDRYLKQQRKGPGRWDARKAGKAAGGLALIIPGIIMIPAPGPGAVIVVLGLAMIADEFRPVASFLDRAELCLRRAYAVAWGKAGLPQRAVIAALALAILALLIYAGIRVFFR